MKTMSTKIAGTPVDLQFPGDKIDALVNERKAWESEEFARSNTRLYNILARCLEIYAYFQNNRRRVNALNTFLADHGLTSQSTTPTATKVVRAVFGMDRRRTYAYSIVLRRAHADKVEPNKFPDWIANMGGVEEVRLSSTDPKSETPEQRRARKTGIAVTALEDKRVLASVKLQTTVPDAANGFVLLLGLVKTDGTVQIVDFAHDPNGTLCQHALEKYGAEINDKQITQLAATKQERENQAFANAKRAAVLDEPCDDTGSDKLSKAA